MHATTTLVAAAPEDAAEQPQVATASARRRPGVRTGYTLDFAVGDFTATLTANARDDGTLREIFIHTGKHGSTLAGLLDTIAATVSIGLRNAVPLQNFVDHLADLAFIPNGPTDDPDITRAASVTDYLFPAPRDRLPPTRNDLTPDPEQRRHGAAVDLSPRCHGFLDG